jgi:hypothetical protein
MEMNRGESGRFSWIARQVTQGRYLPPGPIRVLIQLQGGLQRRGRLVAMQRGRALGDERPGVDAGVHAHQAHAGLLVARQDGGGDGRGAAVPRQQGWMQIQGTVLRYVEDGLRHDAAVVGQHDEPWAEIGDERQCLRSPERRRCQDGDAGRGRPLGDGR